MQRTNFFSTHIPFIVKEDKETLVLEGHVSRANDIWQHAVPTNKAMVLFVGAHAYIHPGWYPTKKETGKVVPTWNYETVHCHGHATFHESEEWLIPHLTQLTHDNENNQAHPWHITDAPTDFIHHLVKGIGGISVTVEKMECAVKMNQHHSQENRTGVIEGLLRSPTPQNLEVAEKMQQLENNKDTK